MDYDNIKDIMHTFREQERKNVPVSKLILLTIANYFYVKGMESRKLKHKRILKEYGDYFYMASDVLMPDQDDVFNAIIDDVNDKIKTALKFFATLNYDYLY